MVRYEEGQLSGDRLPVEGFMEWIDWVSSSCRGRVVGGKRRLRTIVVRVRKLPACGLRLEVVVSLGV